MKPLLSLILLLFLIPGSFAGKRKFSVRHKEEIQKVLAQLVLDELDSTEIHLWEVPKNDFSVNKDESEEWKEEVLNPFLIHLDSACNCKYQPFIKSQLRVIQKINWSELPFPGKIKPETEKTRRLRKQSGSYSHNGTFYFSVPLFSPDYTYALVEHSEYSGPLNAWGQAIIYKKVEGKWKQLKVFNRWVS